MPQPESQFISVQWQWGTLTEFNYLRCFSKVCFSDYQSRNHHHRGACELWVPGPEFLFQAFWNLPQESPLLSSSVRQFYAQQSLRTSTKPAVRYFQKMSPTMLRVLAK